MSEEKYRDLIGFVVCMIIIFIVVLSYKGLQAIAKTVISKPAVAQVSKQADISRQIITALIHLRDGEPCSLSDDGSVFVVRDYRLNNGCIQRVVYVYEWTEAAWIEIWVGTASDAVDRFNKI